MTHELERITDSKSIRGFERSIAFDHDYRVRLMELWQCTRCRSFWEYYGEHTNEDGLILQDGGSVELLRRTSRGRMSVKSRGDVMDTPLKPGCVRTSCTTEGQHAAKRSR